MSNDKKRSVMIARKYLFLFILTVGLLLTGTQGRAAQVDLDGRAEQPAVSSSIVQLAGSTHFSFGFRIGGHHGHGYSFGYYRHHRGRHYHYGRHGHGYYYRHPYRYQYYYRPYYRGYRYRGRHYPYRYRY